MFSKIITDYEPTFISAAREAYGLMKDPVITPEEKLTLQTEAHDCEEGWDALNNNVKLRVDRCVKFNASRPSSIVT